MRLHVGAFDICLYLGLELAMAKVGRDFDWVKPNTERVNVAVRLLTQKKN